MLHSDHEHGMCNRPKLVEAWHTSQANSTASVDMPNSGLPTRHTGHYTTHKRTIMTKRMRGSENAVVLLLDLVTAYCVVLEYQRTVTSHTKIHG